MDGLQFADQVVHVVCSQEVGPQELDYLGGSA